MGRVSPPEGQLVGVGPALLEAAKSQASGLARERVEKLFRETGNLGLITYGTLKAILKEILAHITLKILCVFEKITAENLCFV